MKISLFPNTLVCRALGGAVFLAAALFLALGFTACKQDSLFFTISWDQEPVDPRVVGTPTEIVVVDNKVYVGSYNGRRIHVFSKEKWTSIRTDGALGGVAGVGTRLFALVSSGGELGSGMVVKEYDFVEKAWKDRIEGVPAGYTIASIYGAGGMLFAGAIRRAGYSDEVCVILRCVPGDSTFTLVEDNTSLLTGAAEMGGKVYLATGGHGIYEYAGGSITGEPETTGTADVNMVGIIETGASVIAVSAPDSDNDHSGGRIYVLGGTGFTARRNDEGVIFTGGMGVWKDWNGSAWETSLLLLGVHGEGASLTHGYRETSLNPDAMLSGLRIPGNPGRDDIPPSSVYNEDSYSVSIGELPVNSMLQIPEGVITYPDMTDEENAEWEPPIFAATVGEGLWSYRERRWNAEE